MAKSKKTDTDAVTKNLLETRKASGGRASESVTSTDIPAAPNGSSVAAPILAPVPGAAPSSPLGAAKGSPAKKAVKRTVTPKAAKPATPAGAPVITADDIALQAYFISEKRRAQGLPGSEEQDWLEAERLLRADPKLAKIKPARAKKAK